MGPAHSGVNVGGGVEGDNIFVTKPIILSLLL